MAFKDFPTQTFGTSLLQRSLERGRLGHAYLFSGHDLTELESLARTLAKVLNCENPIRKERAAIDSCDQCLACKKIDNCSHADIHWIRPESKSRIITIDQMRELMKDVQLKPAEAEFKVAVIVAADRLKTEAANAFLKTLEEPPAKSILILLTTEPQRILETLVSRCLRLNFAGEGARKLEPSEFQWLQSFSELAAAEHKSLLSRYRLMDVLVRRLNELKATIESTLTQRSPLQRYKEVEADLTEKWEKELSAAIEAEYRRQRSDLVGIVHRWLRDVWLEALQAVHARQNTGAKQEIAMLMNFPQLEGTKKVAARISSAEAMENLQIIEKIQRWLGTNMQEALVLEVGLLKLRL